jgi:hypothetical protein
MMMKKLLILALVLGMAVVANAGLHISVNGEKNPMGVSLLRPSEIATLDIWTDAAIPGDAGFFALVVEQWRGSISGGRVVPVYTPTGYPGLFIYDDAAGPNGGAMPVPAGTNGVWGGVTVFALANEPALPAGTTIFDQIPLRWRRWQCSCSALCRKRYGLVAWR